ncbi:MAG: hypothetical protein RLZZ350_2348 [Verrucomicrobiota bacterium]|jgi:hypothetical protein
MNSVAPMSNSDVFRKEAIRYWERRRIIYNLALMPPSLVGYAVASTVVFAGDLPKMHYVFLWFWLGLAALGANVCYSFAYALEFLFRSDELDSSWPELGRPAVFIGGTLLAMLLAGLGGVNIANMEFNHRF